MALMSNYLMSCNMSMIML